MLPERIQIKLFISDEVNLADLVPVFHSWIQKNELEGLVLDVADYRHVPNGPGLLLMGHEGDYALDLADGRPGVTYKHKRDWPAEADTFATRLLHVLSRARRAVELLNRDTEIEVDPARFEIRIADRLAVPNTAESFETIQQFLLNEAQDVLGSIGAVLNVVGDDPRKALTVEVEAVPALVG